MDPYHVLAEYDIGAIIALQPFGGTAGRTWKVRAASGDYLLRLRGVRTSSEARLQFDHGLRRHLIECGVPTAAAVPTRTGELWLRREGRVYELYPFVEGRVFDPHSASDIAAAARALARFHQAAASYRPPASDPEPIAQYTTLGFFPDTSDRSDDPHLQKKALLEVRKLAPDENGRAVVDGCLARVEELEERYAGSAYERLCGWITHGDYTPANLLFGDDGEVAGIFDLDWAVPGPRCRDVAEGLYFFAGKPRQINGADIWSLTETGEFDRERCLRFLQAYQGIFPLAPHELDAIPLAFTGLWMSIRLEGMGKVDVSDRFRFFAREVERPLRWLEENWRRLMAT